MLLINPPMCVNQGPRFVSFGTAYIAQELKRNGYDVEILDIDGYRYTKEKVINIIKNSDTDIIGIGGLVTVYPYLDWLIPKLREIKPGIKIVLGGAIASSLMDRCFKRFDIDYTVIGEGEITIIELLQELKNSGNFNSVKGIGFKSGEKIIFTENRPLMESLDSVPIVDYSPFPVEKLLDNSKGVLQIHTQRGCPYNCTFCFNCFRVVSNRVRYRPVNNVIEEIKLSKNKYNVKLFALSGECVMANKKWVMDFCKAVLKNRLKIRYRVTSRADTIDEERLRWLKKSGCTSISLGLESGSAKILKAMKKNTSIEEGRNAARLAKKYIPEVEISMMVGYVGEDECTLRESVRYFKGIGIKPSVFYTTPFPGTELYKMAVNQGKIKNEEDYMMQLDKSSIFNLSLNLTDMPDEKARALIGTAIKEINRYYMWKDLLSLRIFKRAFLYLVKNGLRKTFIKISEMLGLKHG